MKPYALPAILLVANIVTALVLFTQLHHPPEPPTAALPALAAQRIHLAGETALPQAKPEASKLPAMPASAAQASAAPASSAAQASPAEAAPTLCLQWSDLTTSDVQHAESLLRNNAFVGDFEERYAENKAKYWVYIPPLASAEAAKHRALELHGKGIDAFVMNAGGPLPNAVSLALFTKRELADEFLARLKNKGVADAVSRPHPLSRIADLTVSGVKPGQKESFLALAGKIDKSHISVVDCGNSGNSTPVKRPKA